MKKSILYIFMLITTLFCSCKDEYTNDMDRAYFGSYDGHEVKIVGMQLTPNNASQFNLEVHMFSYSSQWPRGTFQIRYGYNHVFDTDTMLYSVDPVPSNHAAYVSVKSVVDYDNILKPGEKVFMKPYYLIPGDTVTGAEIAFSL
ncbi:MAG: hypothetical protein MJZ94_01795 [Bacteroidales bacterium]|nr:hypothetical protein [Bacteroidales bacterium]